MLMCLPALYEFFPHVQTDTSCCKILTVHLSQLQSACVKEMTSLLGECFGKSGISQKAFLQQCTAPEVCGKWFVPGGWLWMCPTEGNFPHRDFGGLCTVCSSINHKLIYLWWMLWGLKRDGFAQAFAGLEMFTLLKMAQPDVEWNMKTIESDKECVRLTDANFTSREKTT